MTISDSTLTQNVWSDVRSIIVAAAPYVTNSTTSATEAASINAVYNDKSANRPQVVIHPVMVDEDGHKFGSTGGKKVINVVIDVVHERTLGVDQLFDQVKAALDANTINGIDLVGFTSDYGFNSPGDQKYHLKSGTFTYVRE